jgi:hypothetical protein
MMTFWTFLTEADKISNKWVNIESVFKTPKDMRDKLKHSVIWVKFLKVFSDPGSIRIGRFTLDPKRIPAEDKPKGKVHGPDYQIRMYEVFPGKNKGQWRSCLFSNVIAVRNAQEASFNVKPEDDKPIEPKKTVKPVKDSKPKYDPTKKVELKKNSSVIDKIGNVTDNEQSTNNSSNVTRKTPNGNNGLRSATRGLKSATSGLKSAIR